MQQQTWHQRVTKNIILNQLKMKKINIIAAMALMVSMLSGCQLVGDIFKAGVWAGIIIVVVVVFLLIWLISKFRS